MTQLKIGDRVMWRYGTKDYANYGEIGTVTATGPMYVTVTMDDSQPLPDRHEGDHRDENGSTWADEHRQESER